MHRQSLKSIRSTIAFLVIGAFLGLVLRFAFVIELPEFIKYKNIQHAHSHGAMMGWLTACFYYFIWKVFDLRSQHYSKIFWISQILVALMIFSFSWQGYSGLSIGLSLIFILINYIFVFMVFKDLRRDKIADDIYSKLFLKASLFFLLFSSIGIWAMGPIIAMALKGTAWYYGAVQFYLHFQFNGWFIFGLLALLFKILEDNKIELPIIRMNAFFKLLFVSCFLSYALSVSWSTPLDSIFWTNSIAVILQGIALIFFLLIIRNIATEVRSFISNRTFHLWGISFFCFSIKILIQTMVAIPVLAKVSYTIRYFIIGFIHLLMLGALSCFFFGLMHYSKIVVDKIGVHLFLIGIILTEGLLFVQGLLIWMRLGFIPQYHLILAVCSIFLFLGPLRIYLRLNKLEEY